MKSQRVAALLFLAGSILTTDVSGTSKPPPLTAPSRSSVQLRLEVPLTGSKTTFRIAVLNNGNTSFLVSAPFANDTRLVTIDPSGDRREHGAWKEGLTPIELKPGEHRGWDMDISSYLGLKSRGTYSVWFEIRDLRSNALYVVKD
jgi:hypothetical protein